MDEVVLKIAGKKHWLWCAVDQTGTVLDVPVQSPRHENTAKRLLRKLLKRQSGWFACWNVGRSRNPNANRYLVAPERAHSGEIAPCGDRLCGRIVWFKRPNDAQGRPQIDSKNTDPALRTRLLLGLTVLRSLHRSGERAWEEGEIYNPDDGTDYKASMSMENNNTLHVRAYLLFPMLGKTETWTRVR